MPTTQVGPATVVLFTGEAAVTEPDAVDTAANGPSRGVRRAQSRVAQ